MESKKIAHLLYVPFTGLGLYGGHRGSRWLKNRIKIFEQFVVPSLYLQTNQRFIIWISWRYEDRNDPQIVELERYLKSFGFKVVFTYAGVCFWDDKYSDAEAYERLVSAVHDSMGELLNVMGEADEVLMTIQPSDDCYNSMMVEQVQGFFASQKKIHVFGYKKGYVMDYVNRRLCEWNPKTTPPFYTIRFPRTTFADPLLHLKYTGPYKSHEYVKDYLPSLYVENRGFLVGTHGSNISTVFDHPYTGHEFLGDNVDSILSGFGLLDAGTLKISWSIRSMLFHKLPYKAKRKLRYWSEQSVVFSWVYNWIRS